MKKNTPIVSIFGVPFPSHHKYNAYRILEKTLSHHGNARIFTPNPEMLWAAHQDAKILSLLSSADFLLPDGNGILLAARLSGQRLPEVITGIDTAEWMLNYAQYHRLSVFLLGGKQGIAKRAEQCLMQKFPSLRICGTHHGYFDKNANSAENQALLHKLQHLKPDLLFVCFGFPLQEQWIAENTPSLPFLRASIGIGGALDIWSGSVRRAPRTIQAIRCEWLWRAVCQPRRFRRLLYLPRFLGAAFGERFQ